MSGASNNISANRANITSATIANLNSSSHDIVTYPSQIIPVAGTGTAITAPAFFIAQESVLGGTDGVKQAILWVTGTVASSGASTNMSFTVPGYTEGNVWRIYGVDLKDSAVIANNDTTGPPLISYTSTSTGTHTYLLFLQYS